VSKLPSLTGYYFFTFVNIIKTTDFKDPDAHYYSNSVVEVRRNEKDVAAPLNHGCALLKPNKYNSWWPDRAISY